MTGQRSLFLAAKEPPPALVGLKIETDRRGEFLSVRIAEGASAKEACAQMCALAAERNRRVYAETSHGFWIAAYPGHRPETVLQLLLSQIPPKKNEEAEHAA